MDDPAQVRCSRVGDVLWIRIEGKGSFQNSGGLKEYLEHLIDEGESKPFVVDLDECPVMDSTFMGALTGLATKIRQAGTGGRVEVVNANTRNRQLLRNLGIDHILEVNDDPKSRELERKLVAAGVATERIESTMSKEEQAEHILEAHRSLGEANPENIPRFKDVVTFFQEDLDKLRDKKDVDSNGGTEDRSP